MIDTVLLLALFAQATTPLPPPVAPPPIRDSLPSITSSPVPASRLSFDLPKLDPKTPVKDLLPAAPTGKMTPVYTGDDLTQVPELRLAHQTERTLTLDDWQKRKAHLAAAALLLNDREEDGYLKAVLPSRPDLAGLPFAMGAACRTKGIRAVMFKNWATLISRSTPDHLAGGFSTFRVRAVAEFGKSDGRAEQSLQSHLDVVRQVMGPGDASQQKVTVGYLGSVPRVEATHQLARMALFSPDAEVRDEAIEALSVRRESDVTEILTTGLRYPWPAVARNAAAAIVKLDRKDLMPKLVDLLDEPDPRGPRDEDGKTIVRELVRVNHHHNCTLCHAPARFGTTGGDFLVAEVPVPGQPLQPPTSGYGSTGSPLLVRIDVTYLRQDFSVMQSVEDHGTWPEQQRFDFLVRKRTLKADEAEELRTRLEKREAGVLSPYQRAAVEALRTMTGRDFEARAEPWRRHLKLKSS